MLVPLRKTTFFPPSAVSVEFKLPLGARPLQSRGEEGVLVCHFVSAWKEGAPVKGAKAPQRNLSGIVMSRQLLSDKIHSFHSRTYGLLVTIVSLMLNWRRCLISSEWVKRGRCFEPSKPHVESQGSSKHKECLFWLWCAVSGLERGEKRVRNEVGPYTHGLDRGLQWLWLKQGVSGTKERAGENGTERKRERLHTNTTHTRRA